MTRGFSWLFYCASLIFFSPKDLAYQKKKVVASPPRASSDKQTNKNQQQLIGMLKDMFFNSFDYLLVSGVEELGHKTCVCGVSLSCKHVGVCTLTSLPGDLTNSSATTSQSL